MSFFGGMVATATSWFFPIFTFFSIAWCFRSFLGLIQTIWGLVESARTFDEWDPSRQD